MAGLKECYCRSNETSLGSQFKWLEYTFNVISTPQFMFFNNGLLKKPHSTLCKIKKTSIEKPTLVF